MTLRKCLTILCDCLVYFDNGNCIKKTTFVTYSLLESSQFSELSLSSVFPENLFILIKRNENGIWMDFYHKPTDTQRCLPFTSSHPNHYKRNIPFCLAGRICTIAENNAEKLKNLQKLKSNLSKHKDFSKPSQYHKKTYENLKNHQIKTSCHSIQHLIQIILIFIVLLNPRLIV